MDRNTSERIGTGTVAPLLRPEEVARLLGISRTKVYELLGRRDLRSFKIGKRRLVEVADLEAYKAALRDAEPGP